MAISLDVFDTTELISFIVAFAAFLAINYLYFTNRDGKKGFDRKYLGLIYGLFLFILLNRFFTNIEAVAYKEIFNLLEHLSSAIAGLVGIMLGWTGLKGDAK